MPASGASVSTVLLAAGVSEGVLERLKKVVRFGTKKCENVLIAFKYFYVLPNIQLFG
jgi:hypothetical protein